MAGKVFTWQDLLDGKTPTVGQIKDLHKLALDQILEAERVKGLAQAKLRMLQGICKHPNIKDAWVCPDCGLDTEK